MEWVGGLFKLRTNFDCVGKKESKNSKCKKSYKSMYKLHQLYFYKDTLQETGQVEATEEDTEWNNKFQVSLRNVLFFKYKFWIKNNFNYKSH